VTSAPTERKTVIPRFMFVIASGCDRSQPANRA
jgi:hypothetical protein